MRYDARVIRYLVAFAVLSAAAPARADDAGVVAVLPFVASDEDLSIYSQPVAQAVVGRLRQAIQRPVEALKLSDKIPDRVTLVVDGRIVEQRGDKVMLTATVRDPGRGTRAGTQTTRVAALTEIDRLAAELGSELGPLIGDAIAMQARASEAEALADPYRDDRAAPVAPPRADGKARLVVVPPAGKIAAGGVAIAEPFVIAMRGSVERLGFTPAVSSVEGGVVSADITRDVRKLGGGHGLLMDLREIDFEWVGVLAARGRVRVTLIDSRGNPRFDRLIRTDTVIGSRGDRHAALISFVAAQALDIAYPALRRALHGVQAEEK